MLFERLRERLSAGIGFVEPCLPSPAKKPPAGSNWIHEIKHDGYRLMARRERWHAATRSSATDGILYAFDLLELNGDDLRREPIEVRKATLASILRKSRSGVRLNEQLEHPEGHVVFQHACKMGLEGIVSKRLGSRYRSGRSPDWLGDDVGARRHEGANCKGGAEQAGRNGTAHCVGE
jgi:bifunctional non-homologous end joining protein LigD